MSKSVKSATPAHVEPEAVEPEAVEAAPAKPALTLATILSTPALKPIADTLEPMESATKSDACKIRAERHTETDLRPALETVLSYAPGSDRSVALAMLRFEIGLNVASSNNARIGALNKEAVKAIRLSVTDALPFKVSVRGAKASAIDSVSVDLLDVLDVSDDTVDADEA